MIGMKSMETSKLTARRGLRAAYTAQASSLAILAGIVGVTALPALAQEAAPDAEEGYRTLEAVVTTSRRREESAQDVPISVSAFGPEQIEKNMFQGVDDLVARTPGVSLVSTGARDRKDISIRGVSNFLTTDSVSKVSTFGFYIDDFNVAIGTTNPQIMDLERIEILRGPQGTYFGRNSIGGAINISTVKPDASEFYAEGTAGYASHNTINLEGIVNVPLIEDVLAVRANIKRTESDGHIENINELGGGNNSEYDYGRLALRYTPFDDLTIDLSGTYTDQMVGMREGVPTGVWSSFAEGLFTSTFGEPLEDGVGFYPENDDKVNFNRSQDVGSEFYTLVGKVQYDFDTFSVTSVTGYIKNEQTLFGDIDGSSLDLFYETKPITRDSFSQEVRIQSTDSGPIEWTVGGLYGEDTGDVNQSTYAGSYGFFGLPEGFVITRTIENSTSETKALFGEAVWHATDRLALTGGLRYTEEEVFLQALDESNGQITNQIEGQSATFDEVTPKLSVSYDFTDDLMAYATASKGFKSGGVQLGSAFASSAYDPETLWNYEVGFKSDLMGGRVRVNGALFSMDWTDLQVQFAEGQTSDEGVVSFISGIQNAASASSVGAELDVTALLTDNLLAHFGAGYIDAEFDEFEGAYIDGNLYDLSGEVLPNTPEWTLSADLEYSFAINNELDGFVRTEWSYRDDTQSELRSLVYSGFPWEVPSYNHVNLRAGFSSEQYSVTAYVDNLFDEEYYTNAYQKAFLGGLHVEPSTQTIGINVTIRTGR